MNKKEHEDFHQSQEVAVKQVIEAESKLVHNLIRGGLTEDAAIQFANFTNRAVNLAVFRRHGACPEKDCSITKNALFIEGGDKAVK